MRPASPGTAVASTAALAAWGNAVVLVGRRASSPDAVTLVAHLALALASTALLRRRGASWRALGLVAPRGRLARGWPSVRSAPPRRRSSPAPPAGVRPACPSDAAAAHASSSATACGSSGGWNGRASGPWMPAAEVAQRPDRVRVRAARTAPVASSSVYSLLAAATTTTEEPPRIVGDPLPAWVVIGAGLAVLVAILVAGLLVQRRMRASASG